MVTVRLRLPSVDSTSPFPTIVTMFPTVLPVVVAKPVGARLVVETRGGLE